MTSVGGANGNGIIFSVDTDGTKYKDLLDFNGTNGMQPMGNLTISGNMLYGMTEQGGTSNGGIVFSIDTGGNTFKILLNFNATNTPYGSLTLLGNKLYGMTLGGGAYSYGEIFNIDTDGSGYKDMLDFNYTSTPEGGQPYYGYLTYASGLLYGMTYDGGTHDEGVIFSQCTLSVTASVKAHESCNGGSSGIATASPSQGVAPYTYLWLPSGENTATATGLSAGIYTVTVTNFNGCSASASVIITQPVSLSITAHTTAKVSCNAGNNGSASSVISGGTLPYTYLWSNNQTTQNITGLSAGTYSVTVNDSCGASVTAAVNITQPNAIAVSANITTNVSCNGENNGSASSSASGGTLPYTYLWSNSQTTQNVSGLSAGIYSVTVSDSCGASVTTSVNITQPTTLGVSVNTTTNVLCNGGDNGSASSTVSGGISPYTYSWTGGAGSNSNASGLTAGTYTVSVIDLHGCTTSAVVTITQPNTLSISASVATNVSCYGYDNGSASSTVSGGISPYTYLWTGGTGSNSTASGLSAGTYTLSVTDSNGCVASTKVVITQPNSLNASAHITTNVSCYGYDNGSASSKVSGGILPYTYSWTGGAGSNSTASGLTAGTYTVSVIDLNGCTSSAAVTITQPANSLSISANTSANVNCHGDNNGSASSLASGGTSPYTYSWTGGAGSTSTASGLTAGTYTVSVIDLNGCINSASVTITQPTSLNTSVHILTNVNCYEGNTGSASSTVSGGTSPYTYLWTGGNTKSTITGLTVGTYTITATDNNGCKATASITITQPSKPDSNLLCWATVDSRSLHNLVSWDTTASANESMDSVLLYFLNANNVWQKIGEESYKDTNQYFVDSTSNPNAVTVRYCVRAIDYCGDTSGYSNWQNTMYISNIGGGTFSWSGTGYLIEGNSFPVLTYYLFRNGIAIDSVSGTQNKITDVNYSPTYQYYVGAKLSIPICPLSATQLSATRVGVKSALTVSHSNTLNSNVTTGINNGNSALSINIYPDPNTGSFTVAGVTQGQTIELYNSIGQKLSSTIAENTTIRFDISNNANGIYLIRILNKDGSIATEKKMVKTQ